MNHVSQEGLLDWAGPILQGALTTLEIAVLAYAIGLVLGLIGASARLSPWAPLRGLATAYSTAVRAVPELLMIILLYYAGSQALTALTNAMGLPGRAAHATARPRVHRGHPRGHVRKVRCGTRLRARRVREVLPEPAGDRCSTRRAMYLR